MDDARLIYHQKTNHHLPRRITDREPVQDYFSFRPAGWKVISLPRRPLPRTEKNGSSLCGGRKRALSFVLALFFYSIPIITGFFSFVKRLTGKIRKKRFLRACGMTAPACGDKSLAAVPQICNFGTERLPLLRIRSERRRTDARRAPGMERRPKRQARRKAERRTNGTGRSAIFRQTINL